MKSFTSRIKWLFGAALLFVAFSPSAKAAVLDIHVSISATKSLQALTTTYQFGALNLGVSSNSVTALVIRNNSGAYVETYTLQGANATSDTSGTSWTLNTTSTGTNQYRLAAMFASSRPDNQDSTWGSEDYLDPTTPGTCDGTTYTDGTQTGAGVSPSPAASAYDRNLWFRMITPGVSTGTEARTAQVTIAVQ